MDELTRETPGRMLLCHLPPVLLPTRAPGAAAFTQSTAAGTSFSGPVGTDCAAVRSPAGNGFCFDTAGPCLDQGSSPGLPTVVTSGSLVPLLGAVQEPPEPSPSSCITQETWLLPPGQGL